MKGLLSAWQRGKGKGAVAASVVMLSLVLLGWGAASAAGAEADSQAAVREVVAAQSDNHESSEEIVVARVNGTAITMDALVKMMNRISAKNGRNLDQKKVEQQALDRLILVNLAYQQAQAQGLEADEKNVQAALANLKRNLGSEEGYEKFLAEQQVSEEELKAQVTRSLTLEVAYAREVYNKVSIPEEEVHTIYEREKERYVTPERMRVVDVLFLQQDSEDAVRQRAEEVLEQIKAEKDQNAWRLSLDGTFIVRTYDIDKDRDKELYKAGLQLKEGELSGIINTAKAVHIIKMQEYSPARQLTLDEVRGRIENGLRVPAQDRRLKAWEKELRKEAKIEIVWPELQETSS